MSSSLSTPHDHIHAAVLLHSATRFIVTHQAEHLDNEQLIKRCCAHLMTTTGITESAAQHYTMHALAELQAKHAPAYFDISHSTSYVVRVVDPTTGNAYALTASDVLQIAKAQHDHSNGPMAHVTQQCGRRAG
jgi:phosphopantetheinyl transferase